MILLRTAEEIADFLATPTGKDVAGIITAHLDRLAECGAQDLAAFAICGPGDSLDDVPGIDPDWPEYVQHHRGWTEAVFITSDDGAGWVVLRPDP